MIRTLATVAVGCGLAAVLGSCDQTGQTNTSEEALIPIQGPTRPARGICSLGGGQFSTDVDNPFFPLPVGRHLVLEGTDDEGALLRVESTVLAETEEIAGIPTRVVEVMEFEDGELIERVHDFYAQAADGTVCYFGEDVDQIENGQVVGHPGAWRAGEQGNQPGVIMPGTLRTCTEFAQERAPGIAEDRSAVVALDLTVSVPAGEFANAAFLLDWNPLEGQTIIDGEHKVYVPGVGLVIDEDVQLVRWE